MRRLLLAGSTAFVLAFGAFAASGFGRPADAAPEQKDPLPAFLFQVTISVEGIEAGQAFFRSIEGLSSETEVIDYQEGGSSQVLKMPGRTHPPRLVLTRDYRGKDPDDPMLGWYREIVSGKDIRKNITITIVKRDKPQSPAGTYEFSRCFPVKWTGPTLDPGKNENAVEKIEIAVERWDGP